MILKTQFDSRERVFAHPGDPIRKTYVGRYDDKGRVVLEEKGSENIYEQIQSHADSVNINTIVKRFASGDTEVLTRAQSFYGDITQMPTNLAQSLNHIRACEETFDALPVDVRAKFNHNFTEFLAAAGSPEFLAALGVKRASVDDASAENTTVKKEEVSE